MTAPSQRRDRSTLAFLKPLAVAGIASLLLTACTATTGGDGSTGNPAQKNAEAVYEQFSTITGDEREQQLYEAAKDAGGEITVYTSNSAIDDIVDGFEDKYDGLTINTYRAEPAAFIQRFFQEQDAGFYGVDVVEDADASLVTEKGLAGSYVNDPLTSQIRDLDAVNGEFIPTRGGAVVVSWNTDKVKESDLPDSLEGFTDPQWKGRLSMTDAEWAWYMTLSKQWVADGQSQDDIDTMFETLASYSTIVSSHTLQAQLLAAGEYDVALTTFNHAVDQLIDDGAPVAWKKADGTPAVEPIVYGPEGAVPIINAPNPAGALLFIDYELTDGQGIMADGHRPTSIPQATDPLAGATLLNWPQDEYINNRDQWEKKFSTFMKAGTPAK